MRAGMVVILVVLLYPGTLFSQDTVKAVSPMPTLPADTLPTVDLRAVVIFPPAVVRTPRESARYDKLVYNVKKVYPYAKEAGRQLARYRDILDTIPSEKERKVFLKKAEKELEERFGKEVRDLTFSQGKILIKLIYRETGNSTFDIVKQLRGGFTAFIWQTMARIFGYDLKTGYDPAGNDQAIEQIVLMIEAGAL